MHADPSSLLTRSDVESRRFGYEIYRCSLEELDEYSLFREILKTSPDILFLNLPAGEIGSIHRLEFLGMPFYTAGTSVQYACPLALPLIEVPKMIQLQARPLTRDNLPVLEKLVGEIFEGYENHYSSNPYLDKRGLVAGYREWASSSLRDKNTSGSAWLFRHDGRDAGFWAGVEKGDDCEVFLAGVSRECRGIGAYLSILRHAQEHYRARGRKTMFITTQSGNIPAQKRWHYSNVFRLQASSLTVHICPFFHKSISEKIEINERPSADDLKPFRENAGSVISAWMNHRLRSAWKRAFPSAKICQEYQTQRIFREIREGGNYRLTVSFPFADEAKGTRLSACILKDEDAGEICALSYIRLLSD